jgi:hypothetical protein
MQRLDQNSEPFKRIANIGVPRDDEGGDERDNEAASVPVAQATSESASPPPPPSADEEGDRTGKIKFHRPSIIKALFPKEKDKAHPDTASP